MKVSNIFFLRNFFFAFIYKLFLKKIHVTDLKKI